MEQKPLDRLRGVVERIIYPSDGCSVLKCAAKGHTDLVAVVEMMPDTHIGLQLSVPPGPGVIKGPQPYK